MANSFVIDCVAIASGANAIGISVSIDADLYFNICTATTGILVGGGATANVYGCEYAVGVEVGSGILNSLQGDRSAWDTGDYPTRHAFDIADSTFVYHNDPLNPPLSSILSAGSFYVGSMGGVATAVSMSGDATMGPTGIVTLSAQAVDAANIAMTNGSIFIGGADGAAHEQSVSGDASISNAGIVTLATVNADVGTYGDDTHLAQITVDEKGRITAIGEIIFSSDEGAPQVYNETQIADGVSLTYYLLNVAVAGSIRVYINGIRQPASDDAAPTDVVTFSSAPALDAVLVFDYELETA